MNKLIIAATLLTIAGTTQADTVENFWSVPVPAECTNADGSTNTTISAERSVEDGQLYKTVIEKCNGEIIAISFTVPVK